MGRGRKKIWTAGDTAYVIVRQVEPYQSYRIGAGDKTIQRPPSTIIEFWTGDGMKFVGGGTAAYKLAKLFKNYEAAEQEAAKLVLLSPGLHVGRLEVIEQVVWADIWS